ncbi:hypothetical protein FQN53_000470 [Emmonsiellopsis sp. PD_33]|nr:hypothetical protein FQN53_000470 [Emmonsiellopsis sp. PD_33]
MASIKLAEIQRIERLDASSIIRAITQDGCCIIKNFTDDETVKKANEEIRPYLEADRPWKAIRSLAMTFDIGPGGKAQRLHRDDKNYHVDHEDQTQTGYRVGSDVMMAFMVPGVETTFENGATTAIPRSHLWGSDRAPKIEESIAAEMEVGDAWVMLGGLYHAGGANITENERRIVHGFFFCRGYYRHEENIYLANAAEDVLSWGPEVQRIMGYQLSSPNIGFVDFKGPIQYLQGVELDEFGDFGPSQGGK